MSWYNKWALMVLAAGAYTIAYNFSQDIRAADWGTWIGSIGTVGTLYWAIRLSQSERKQRALDTKNVAEIAAAGMYFQLIHNEENIKYAIHNFEKMHAHEIAAQTIFFVEAVKKLNDVHIWEPQELLRLVALPNNCAMNLASAQGRILSTQKILNRQYAPTVGQIEFPGFIQGNCEILMSALPAIRDLILTCEKTATDAIQLS